MEETAMHQVEALKSRTPLPIAPEELAEESKHEHWNETYIEKNGEREWPGFAKILERLDPAYRD